MKRILTLLILLLALSGCVSIDEKTSSVFGEAFGKGFGHVVNDSQILINSVAWYYRNKEKWPTTKEDLVNFNELQKAPFDLSKYTKIKFTTVNDEEVKCDYAVIYETEEIQTSDIHVKSAAVTGSFNLTTQMALSNDLNINEMLKEIKKTDCENKNK